VHQSLQLGISILCRNKGVLIMNHPKVVGIVHENQCCESAEKILNDSQGRPSSSQRKAGSAVGHPRFHVLCKKENGQVSIVDDDFSTECTDVLTERLGNWKTAFQNKSEQNRALHEILTMPCGKQAIEMLNDGAQEVILRVPANQLIENRNLFMTEVANGKRMGTREISSFVLILGHHAQVLEGFKVHIKTFYPTDRVINNISFQ
jgi:hypothetical protein